MIKMLVIYDDTGRILLQGTGIEEPVGVPFAYFDVEDGEYITNIDTTVTPHEAVKIKNTSQLDELQTQVDALNMALAEMMGV